jgi:Tfp pilus assembly protein PilO
MRSTSSSASPIAGLMELKEIIGSVDKWKLARGIAVIVLALTAIGALAWWLIYMLA